MDSKNLMANVVGSFAVAIFASLGLFLIGLAAIGNSWMQFNESVQYYFTISQVRW